MTADTEDRFDTVHTTHPAWGRQTYVVRTRWDGENGFYASTAKLGMGRAYRTRDHAIAELLHDHALSIVPAPKSV